jgi:glycosyltransferase involved in cell wall biosynthesis
MLPACLRLRFAALYINPDNLSELISAIQRLSSEPELRQRLIQLGLQQVAKFSWRDSATQTLAVLESVKK